MRLGAAALLPALALGAPLAPLSARHQSESAPRATGLGTGGALQCNNASAIMTGFYYPMTGYSKVPAKSAQECCGLCSSDVGKCLSWTWGNVDTKCHLKAAAPTHGDAKPCEAPCAAGPPAGPPGPAPPPAPPPSPAPMPPQPAGPPKGPNILLLFPDQWRYDWDGFTRDNQPDIPGPMLHVPTTRKVASEGTRFTTAYVPAPVCAPSRSWYCHTLNPHRSLISRDVI